MKEVFLLKLGETVLKGLNRYTFEDMLIRNLRRRLKRIGNFRIAYAQSAISVIPQAGTDENGGESYPDLDAAQGVCDRLFGIVSVARAACVEKDIEIIKKTAAEYCAAELGAASTFKVASKRSDKRFPLNSPQICEELGAYLLGKFPHLKVNLREPGVTVTVEIRDTAAYVHCGGHHGAGGLPTGSSGKGAVLISGGLDSPVAAWKMARRGLILEAVHFASPPYTGPQAEQKVIDLTGRVSAYSGRIYLHIVPFAHIQEEIASKCPQPLSTVLMRRFMMRIAERIGLETGCECLITGESLGQVASQTIGAIACTDDVCTLPVMRPLIGSDKEEIVSLARRLGTFETSILPYEDCCTVFTPRHPKTKPRLSEVREAESALDAEALISEAILNSRKIMIQEA